MNKEIINHEFLKKLGRSAELREKRFKKTITLKELKEFFKLKDYFMEWFIK